MTHSPAGQIFIALTAMLLAIFLVLTWTALARIASERELSRRFLESWLGSKADCVALVVAPDVVRPRTVLSGMAVCDRLFRHEIENRKDMEKILFHDGRVADIAAPWKALRDYVRTAALSAEAVSSATVFMPEGRWVEAVSPVAAASIATLLALAARFETALGTRLAAMQDLETGQYRALLTLLASIVIAMIALLFAGTRASIDAARDRAGRLRLEDLMGATFEAQEAERRRIALDLHDSVAQELAATLMAARRLDEDESGSRALVIESLKTSIGSLRRIAWELRPPELDRLGFKGAALELLDVFAKRGPFDVKTDFSLSEAGGPGQAASMQLFRILQESLANVRRHSKASVLRVAFASKGGICRLEIEDDGIGFVTSPTEEDLAPQSGGPGHLGLAGMRERARLAGGWLEIDSFPGRGTRIVVEVPNGS
ncbi:MAG TPA: sensor histidine kinase [Rectinemataceae bacterium]|nr:sensor histidine kinase [Rectinemataceae bacterium]